MATAQVDVTGLLQSLLDQLAQRSIVVGDALPGGQGRLGLEAGLGDDDAEALPRVDTFLGEQLDQDGEGGHSGWAGPDPFAPGQASLRREDVLVLDVGGETVLLAEPSEDPLSLAPRIPRGQSLGDRISDLDRLERRSGCVRAADGVGPCGLGRDQRRDAR